jgi:hypothetical protein
LDLNLSGEKQRCARITHEIFVLDNAVLDNACALVEGHARE